MSTLSDYIGSRTDLTPQQQETWLTYCHLLDESDKAELLSQFLAEPGVLLEMTSNIEAKQRALASGDPELIAAILAQEQQELQ
jgi:hypothetical protein